MRLPVVPAAPPERPAPPSSRRPLARRLARVALARVRGEVRDATVQVETASGARRRALLADMLAPVDEAASEGWRLHAIDPASTSYRFLHVDGRTLKLSLLPTTAPRFYVRLDAFALGYSLKGALTESDRRFLDRVVARLRAADGTLRSDSERLKILRDRRASELTVYLRDHRVELRPTLACNHHCGFCNSVDRGIDNVLHGLADLRESVRSWSHLPVLHVALSGGEPTLLPDLPRMLEELSGEGFLTELQTNGMALADAAYARTLAQAGLRRVLVSLHSHRAATSDAEITLHPGGWERTVAGIDQALAAGIDVHLSHVVHRANHLETKAFLEFVAARWGRRVRVRLAFVAPAGADHMDLERHLPPLPEVLPEVRRALAFAWNERLRVTLVGQCGIPPCLLAPHVSFSDVPYAPPAKVEDDHVQLAACRACAYRERCPGLWRTYFERHGDPGLTPLSRPAHLARPLRWWRLE